MGDWLYMTSFYLALKLKNFRVLNLLIDVTRKMVEGELIQWEQYGRIDLSVEEQLEICRRKTAHLFSGCGRLGAILADMDEQQEEKLGTFGHSIGMAFQLTDDLLDYTSNEDTLGKPVLKDLEEGKITLPIIYLMERADQKEQDFVRDVVRTQDFSSANKKRIMELVQAYGTLKEVQSLAEEYARKAKTTLLDFPDSIYREALLNFTDFVIDREN
jgi:octaprenyl-diphosphate synthase